MKCLVYCIVTTSIKLPVMFGRSRVRVHADKLWLTREDALAKVKQGHNVCVPKQIYGGEYRPVITHKDAGYGAEYCAVRFTDALVSLPSTWP